MPQAKPDDVEVKSPVAPLESTETSPVKESKEKCWNCEGSLDNEGICSKCGFDKKLLYNLNLEAERAATAQKAQQAKT